MDGEIKLWKTGGTKANLLKTVHGTVYGTAQGTAQGTVHGTDVIFFKIYISS